VLTGARRDLPERQQTLRATIEWSYDLCSTEEQQLFGRLAVFVGGFTLDMAETVCDADLDTLASLLDKNLVRREGERFSMLETIREYAVERLEESGAADEIRRRLAVYMTELAESTEGDYLGPEQAAVQRRFRAEWDNVRAVLEWALEAGEVEVGLRLIGSLTMLWLDRNVAVEGEQWLQTFLERAESVDVGVRAKALMTGAMVAGVRSEYPLAAARTEEALGHFRSVGSREGIAWSLTGLAVAAIEFGRPEDAGPLLEEAEELSRQVGNDAGLRRVLHLRGQHAQAVGEVERGRELLREAAERSKSVGDMFSAATSVHSLGDLELEAHRLEVAEEEYKEGLGLSQRAGADRLVCYCIAGLAAVAADRGDADRAATLWGFAEAYEAQLKFRMRGRSVYDGRLAPLARENPDRYASGRTLDLAAAEALALS
jgi:tetratricopeptide (TPR) repeat protein